MRFRIYPHLFPIAMLNIMQYGKKFLKAVDPEYSSMHNGVLIESNGTIDPYRHWGGQGPLADNGASLLSWNNENLYWYLNAFREPDEDGHQLDDTQMYVCQIPKSTCPPCSHFYPQSSRILK